MINAVELASQYDQLKGKKLTFIISPQWFTNHGLTNQNFDARMSQTQINQMFNQKDMPADLKETLCTKIITIPACSQQTLFKRASETS